MKKYLKCIPLFSDLSDEDLESIAQLAVVSRIPKKYIVVQEGEIGDSMYVILLGSVKIVYYTPDGREVILSILESGDFFGEMSLLDQEPRSATVMTLENSEFAYIRHSDFEHLMAGNPKLTIALLNEVVKRLRRTSHILERVSTMDVPHRLYDYLCYFCQSHGSLSKQGQYIVSLPTHRLIADQLSTSRETISRAISALKKKGIISPIHGRRAVNVDTNAMESLLEGLQ